MLKAVFHPYRNLRGPLGGPFQVPPTSLPSVDSYREPVATDERPSADR